MPAKRGVREVPRLDPAFHWTLPLFAAEDVTTLAANVRARRRPIPLQEPVGRVAERLNLAISRAIGTYVWRQTWEPAEYRDWAEKVEAAAQRLLQLLGDGTSSGDEAVEHLTSEPVWYDGLARAAAGHDPEEAPDEVRRKIAAVRDLRTLASAYKAWCAGQPAVRRQAAEQSLVKELAEVFEWAFKRSAGVSTNETEVDDRRGGPTLAFIGGALRLAGKRIPEMEPGREALAKALLQLAKRPYALDERLRKLRPHNGGGPAAKSG
jgi:hypothetical protein